MKRSPNQYQIQYVTGSMLGSGRKMAKATYQSVMQILQGYTVLYRKGWANLYVKTIDHLSLYASIQFKNGRNLVMCLSSEEFVGPEVLIMPNNTTGNSKHVWDYKINDLLKTKHLLKGNLLNLYTVLMALCKTKIRS